MRRAKSIGRTDDSHSLSDNSRQTAFPESGHTRAPPLRGLTTSETPRDATPNRATISVDIVSRTPVRDCLRVHWQQPGKVDW